MTKRKKRGDSWARCFGIRQPTWTLKPWSKLLRYSLVAVSSGPYRIHLEGVLILAHWGRGHEGSLAFLFGETGLTLPAQNRVARQQLESCGKVGLHKMEQSNVKKTLNYLRSINKNSHRSPTACESSLQDPQPRQPYPELPKPSTPRL